MASLRCGADRVVERGPRRADAGQRGRRIAVFAAVAAQVQDGAERSAQAPAHLICRRDQRRVPRGIPELPSGSSTQKHGPSRLTHQAQAGPREQLQFRRHAIGLPRLGRRADLGSLRVLVEHQRQQLHPRRAVDRCVVEDREDREALIGQALDHIGQPQWPPPVERPRDDAPDDVGELLIAARRRDRRMAHVELQLEVRIVDPERMIEPERDLGQAPA